jgi:hypothetical protein
VRQECLAHPGFPEFADVISQTKLGFFAIWHGLKKITHPIGHVNEIIDIHTSVPAYKLSDA